MNTPLVSPRTPHRRRRTGLLACTALTLLSACGGGGGGNAGSNRQWSDPATLEFANPSRHLDQVLALAQDPKGNAVALWQNKSNTSLYELRAASYRPRHGWASDVLSMGEDTPMQAALALNERGNGVAIFTNNKADVGMSYLLARGYRADSGWAEHTILLNESPAEKVALQVAVDPAGQALVVWQEDNQIVGCRLLADLPDCQPEAISDAIEGNASQPQLFMDKQGHTLLLWTQNLRLRGRRYQSGSWGSPLLATGIIKDNHYVIQQNGSDLLLVWEHYGLVPGSTELLARRISLTSATAPDPASVITGFVGTTTAPTLAFDGRSGVIAWQNWQEENGSWQFRAYASQEKNGSWEPARKVADTQTAFLMPPDLRALPGANGQPRLWWSDDSKDYISSPRADGEWHVDTELPYSFRKYTAQAGSKTLLVSTQAWVASNSNRGPLLPITFDPAQAPMLAVNPAGMATLLFMADGSGNLLAHSYR